MLQSNHTTNAYRPDALLVAQPTVSKAVKAKFVHTMCQKVGDRLSGQQHMGKEVPVYSEHPVPGVNPCWQTNLRAQYIQHMPHVGSGIVRIDPLRFLAGCHKRQLNQALSVLSLSLGFF